MLPAELVVKVRISDSPGRHFVLVDLPTSDLSWLRLVAASCAALGIPVKVSHTPTPGRVFDNVGTFRQYVCIAFCDATVICYTIAPC